MKIINMNQWQPIRDEEAIVRQPIRDELLTAKTTSGAEMVVTTVDSENIGDRYAKTVRAHAHPAHE